MHIEMQICGNVLLKWVGKRLKSAREQEVDLYLTTESDYISDTNPTHFRNSIVKYAASIIGTFPQQLHFPSPGRQAKFFRIQFDHLPNISDRSHFTEAEATC